MSFVAAISALLVHAGPFEINDLQLEGEIRKPTSFLIMSAPTSVTPFDARAPLERLALEVRLLVGLRSSIDYLQRARALAAEAQEVELAAFDAYDHALECQRADCPPLPPEPAGADFRRALDALAVAAVAPGADTIAEDRLALSAYLWLANGPAFDAARGERALTELLARTTDTKFRAWARLMLAERAFDASDIARAAEQYRALVATDAASPVAPYARYKLAWCSYNLDEVPDGIELLKQLVDPSPKSDGNTLAREAERDLVVFWGARAELAGDAIAWFKATVPSRADERLVALADQYNSVALADATARVIAAIDPSALTAEQRARYEDLKDHPLR